MFSVSLLFLFFFCPVQHPANTFNLEDISIHLESSLVVTPFSSVFGLHHRDRELK